MGRGKQMPFCVHFQHIERLLAAEGVSFCSKSLSIDDEQGAGRVSL
jgi:hypothetical protein